MAFNFKRGVKRISRYLKQHQPAIFAGTACAGVVITAVIAVRCHTKADDILCDASDDLEEAYEACDEEAISEAECLRREREIKIDCAKALGVAYAPAVLSGVLTITTIILSHKAHLRHEAVLTTALNGATALLGDYKDEAKKLLKPKQKEELEHNVAKKQMQRRPVPSEDMIHETGLGNQLMLIEKTGMYVRISEDNLNKILHNKIQKGAESEGYRTYNDLEWELCHFQSGDGAEYGWLDSQFQSGDILEARVTYANYENNRTGERESVGIVRFSIDPVILRNRPSQMYY